MCKRLYKYEFVVFKNNVENKALVGKNVQNACTTNVHIGRQPNDAWSSRHAVDNVARTVLTCSITSEGTVCVRTSVHHGYRIASVTGAFGTVCASTVIGRGILHGFGTAHSAVASNSACTVTGHGLVAGTRRIGGPIIAGVAVASGTVHRYRPRTVAGRGTAAGVFGVERRRRP